MIPYFSLFIFFILLVFMGKPINSSKVTKRFFIGFIYIVLVLFSGLRSSSVGTDTNAYARFFQSLRVLIENPWESSASFEIGYLFLEKIARLFSDNYMALLIIIAMVVIFFYLKAIVTLSENYLVSIFVFISIETYLFSFNGARQGIAAAIFTFAIIEIVKGRQLRYYFWVMVAFMFHKTVILMLPFYYLVRLKLSKKNILIIIVIVLTLVLSLTQLPSLFPSEIGEKYTFYLDRKATGGYLLTVYYMLNLIIFLYTRKYITQDRIFVYDIYLNLSIYFTLIYLVISALQQDVTLLRFSLYFSMGGILIWPMILNTLVRKLKMKVIIYMIFFLMNFIFYKTYIEKIGDLTPYIFNIEGF